MPADEARKVRRSARDDDTWSAWICDRDRLLRLAEAMDRCIAPVRETQAKQAEAGGTTGTTAAGQADRFTVQLLARHSHQNLETLGPPESVLEDLDASGLDSVSLTVGTHEGILVSPTRIVDLELLSLRSSLTSNGDDKWFAGVRLSKRGGAALHVDGTDTDWVASTFSKLQHECRKAVPWWWWLRHGGAWFGYTLIALLVAGVALQPTLGDGRWWVWALYSAGIALVLGTATTVIARRVLPGFELLSSGQSGKGSTVLTFLLALVSQIPIGVLVNVMTQGGEGGS